MPLDRYRAGVIAVLTIAVLSTFAWLRLNPFASPFELHAVFEEASSLRPASAVRIAGVDVGKVTEVEPVEGRGARVTMELQERALPIHADAQLKVRPRIFLGGNFFVDVEPGSPAAGTLEDGDTIPSDQTAAGVQVGDVLAALKADTRADLQTLVREYSRALREGGARGVHQALPHLAPAYRDLALTSDALLGERPEADLRRALRGTQRTVAALGEDERALQDLVSDLATVTGALAREDDALAASVAELRLTLVVGYPALGSLNASLPSVRLLARAALPGVRRLVPTVRAARPLLRQTRALVGPRELRATARVLRRRVPDLFDLIDATVPLLEQGRAASRCTRTVLVPFVNSEVPDPDFPENKGTVNQKLQRSFVGLAGESRTNDANQSYFHAAFVPSPPTYRPAPPPGGVDRLPPRRPDVPCETQEPPDLEAPGATVAPNGGLTPLSAGSNADRRPSRRGRRDALLEAKRLVVDWQRGLERRRARALAREAGR